MSDLTLPDISQPVTDPQSGRMNPVWYAFFARLLIRLNALPSS